MRELTMSELECVSGGGDGCTSSAGGNDYGGISDTQSVGKELIELYEGVVEATSYIIERIANAL